MKRKNFKIWGILTLTLFALSCSVEEDITNGQNDNRNLKVSYEPTVAQTEDEFIELRQSPKSGLVRNQLELIEGIKGNKLLNEVYDDAMLLDLVRKSKFDGKSVTSLDYSQIVIRYPNRYERILEELNRVIGIGNRLGDLWKGTYGLIDDCKPAKYSYCSGIFDTEINFQTDETLLDLSRGYIGYVRSNFNEKFLLLEDEYSQLPVPKEPEYVFEQMDFGQLGLEGEDQEWLMQSIKEGTTQVFGSTILADNQEVEVAYLSISNQIKKPEIFQRIDGVFLCNYLPWCWGQYYFYQSGSYGAFPCRCRYYLGCRPPRPWNNCNFYCFDWIIFDKCLLNPKGCIDLDWDRKLLEDIIDPKIIQNSDVIKYLTFLELDEAVRAGDIVEQMNKFTLSEITKLK